MPGLPAGLPDGCVPCTEGGILKYDIVIIGAGPAGSLAARTAAAAGLKTLLIEKRSRIGWPVRCGEGVSPQTCQAVGVTVKPYHYVESTDFVSPGGTRIRLSTPCYLIDRAQFDQDLADHAVQHGAELWLNARATRLIPRKKGFAVAIKKDGKTLILSPKVIIAADGVESEIARMVGKPALKLSEVGTAAAVVVEGLIPEPEAMLQHYFGDPSFGYFWAFPKGHGLANIGVGWIAGKMTRVNPIDVLRQKLSTPEYKQAKVLHYTSGAVPMTRRLRPLHEKNVLFVGDAARLSNPIIGDGMTPALLSGVLAGKAAVESVLADDPRIFATYDAEWARQSSFGTTLEDMQAAFFKLQRTLLALPTDKRTAALELLWISAKTENKFPFSISNARLSLL